MSGLAHWRNRLVRASVLVALTVGAVLFWQCAVVFAEANDAPPGVPLPGSPFPGQVRTTLDWEDIYNITLGAGDTLHLTVHQTDGLADVDLGLFPPGTIRVDDTSKAVRLSRKARLVDEEVVYKVPEGASGLYLVDIWVYDGDYADYMVTWSVESAPTAKTARISNSAAPRTVAYKGLVTVKAALTDESGQTIKGKTLNLQRSYNRTTWSTYTARNSLTGAYSVPVRIDRKTYFRWQLPADSEYTTSTSAATWSISRANLKPIAFPSTMRFNRSYRGVGYLWPKHTSGSVIVYEYYLSGGRWKLLDRYDFDVTAYSSYSRYIGWADFWGSGRWKVRMRAYHADADHAPTYSAWRYFTVY